MAAVDRNRGSIVNFELPPAPERGPAPTELAELRNEFAAVRIALDERGNGPRLLVQDMENGVEIYLSPLELASLCLADADDRLRWLRVGHYREERSR